MELRNYEDKTAQATVQRRKRRLSPKETHMSYNAYMDESSTRDEALEAGLDFSTGTGEIIDKSAMSSGGEEFSPSRTSQEDYDDRAIMLNSAIPPTAKRPLSGAERQRNYRERLKQDKKKLEIYKEKDRNKYYRNRVLMGELSKKPGRPNKHTLCEQSSADKKPLTGAERQRKYRQRLKQAREELKIYLEMGNEKEHYESNLLIDEQIKYQVEPLENLGVFYYEDSLAKDTETQDFEQLLGSGMVLVKEEIPSDVEELNHSMPSQEVTENDTTFNEVKKTLTGAERQRNFRKRLREDKEKYAIHREKQKEKYYKQRKLISEQSEEEKALTRLRWRRSQARARSRSDGNDTAKTSSKITTKSFTEDEQQCYGLPGAITTLPLGIYMNGVSIKQEPCSESPSGNVKQLLSAAEENPQVFSEDHIMAGSNTDDSNDNLQKMSLTGLQTLPDKLYVSPNFLFRKAAVFPSNGIPSSHVGTAGDAGQAGSTEIAGDGGQAGSTEIAGDGGQDAFVETAGDGSQAVSVETAGDGGQAVSVKTADEQDQDASSSDLRAAVKEEVQSDLNESLHVKQPDDGIHKFGLKISAGEARLPVRRRSMSAAERQRRYREKIRQNPEKYRVYREKQKLAKDILIRSLPEEKKAETRVRWRLAKQRQREKQKIARQNSVDSVDIDNNILNTWNKEVSAGYSDGSGRTPPDAEVIAAVNGRTVGTSIKQEPSLDISWPEHLPTGHVLRLSPSTREMYYKQIEFLQAKVSRLEINLNTAKIQNHELLEKLAKCKCKNS